MGTHDLVFGVIPSPWFVIIVTGIAVAVIMFAIRKHDKQTRRDHWQD